MKRDELRSMLVPVRATIEFAIVVRSTPADAERAAFDHIDKHYHGDHAVFMEGRYIRGTAEAVKAGIKPAEGTA